MDMKLDKDTLVKHQFWILLGSYLLIWFIAMLWLPVAASEPIATAKKNYDGATSSLKTASSNPVNTATFLPPWEKAAETFNAYKSVIWGKAWEFQAGMYSWPEKWEKTKDMTRPQTELSADDRADYRHKLYPAEIENLRKHAPEWLYPVELADGFDQFFEPKDWKETPTREEIWLAQEDFWVKRELLLVIWKAMADLAYMQPVAIGEDEKTPDGVEARYRYHNQNWEITLNLRKNKDGVLVLGGDSTIQNINPTHRTQTLTSAKGEGIRFSVLQDRTRTEFEVRGEPLAWSEKRAFSMNKDNEREDYEPLDGIAWDKIKDRPIYVSQGFDRTNSPIRGIRAIALGNGAQDCRTYHWLLQPNHALARLDALPEDPDAKKDMGAPAGPGGPPGMGGKPGMGGPPGMGSPPVMATPPGMGGPPGMNSGSGGRFGQRRGGASAESLTPNNQIDRNRYLQPADLDKKLNPPSRHLPLALRLVVEQSHMHDVMLAMANSRLRLQITQVEYHHAKDYVPQGDPDKKDGTDKGGYSRVFMGGMPSLMYGGSAGMGPRGPSSRPGVPPGMPAPPGMGGPGSLGGSSGMRMPGQMMGAPPPMMPPGMGGPGGRGKFRPTMSPGSPRGGFPRPPGSSDANQTVQIPQDDNLVEITIYSIATLYRRPDPPKTAEQSDQPGRPGRRTPPSGQQPTPPAGQQPTPPAGQQPTPPAGKQPAPPAPPAPAGKQPAPPAGKKP